jgi:hypothetical protein
VKTVALAAPLVVLGLLHLLQKLESWTVEGPHGQNRSQPARRQAEAVASRRARRAATHG